MYAVHIVNNGATRQVILTGPPAQVKTLHYYVTNQARANQPGQPVPVLNGQARFTLAASSYATLASE
ncbi:MAG: hypothetical protein EOO36_00020 [Cytophagaceae bacterium]|nr:MAG: hypothetical protein EOO36_00020 [Cytophagaceae bacterium]